MADHEERKKRRERKSEGTASFSTSQTTAFRYSLGHSGWHRRDLKVDWFPYSAKAPPA